MTSYDILDPVIGVPQVHYTGPIFDIVVFLFVIGFVAYAVRRFLWVRFGGTVSTVQALIGLVRVLFTKSTNR